jgi:type IVB pilus formation R64 PilN family outer membrane protein
MMFFKRILFLCLSVTVVLSGCNSKLYNQTEANVADGAQRAIDARHQSDASAKPPGPLVINQGMYVDKTPISLSKQPSWLKNKIILRGDQLPFSYYSRTIASGGGKDVLTHYQVGLDQVTQVSLNYSGTVKGALDLLAAKTGYVYTINGGDVYWQAFITKTFDVAFMPGSSDYQMGKSGGGGGGASGGGAAGGNVTMNIVNDNTDQEYSNLKGQLSVWKDLKESITQMLSADGKVMVSESTTTVTVRDRPSNVSLIARYIANLNNTLSKQVLVKVEVLDVGLSSAYNFGINWQMVKESLGTQFQLNANYGTPISISTLNPFVQTTSLVGGANGLPQFGAFNNKQHSTGATVLINALTQQGKVSVVTQPRVVCLNNQVSVIRITAQTGYLASVQTTALGSSSGSTTVNNNTITSQVTPGSVVSGLTLYILPKILGKRVYLQVNADLTTLLNIQTISSQGSGTASATSNAPLIQVPNITQKQFNQRAVIGSGDTLILSGFRQVANTANAMQMYNSQELGGKAAVQQNSETIVLITPIILPGYA